MTKDDVIDFLRREQTRQIVTSEEYDIFYEDTEDEQVGELAWVHECNAEDIEKVIKLLEGNDDD